MWTHLKKVKFHKLNEHRYDRKGTICTLFFESFPNSDYHQRETVYAVRAITSLLNSGHTLQRLSDYNGAEFNQCWIYYGLCLDEDRKQCQEKKWIPCRVDHKYWGPTEIETFKTIIRALAKRYDAQVTGYA
jgi:hypothetical protein